MAHIYEDTSPYEFNVSPADLEVARVSLAHDEPIPPETLDRWQDTTHAAAVPISVRLAVFQADLECSIRSVYAQEASDETLSSLLAVAVQLSRRFPELR
jgi:hypothetical protein